MHGNSQTGITRIIALSAVAAILAAAVPGASQATEIGSVTAASPRIDGTPPNGRARILKMGQRVLAEEVIVTSEIGSGQFVFLDQTTLTVSPGSEIVLDRYVYDPERGSGEVALTLTKGVLRFIGGKITKNGQGTVTTPHATIGVRGGIAAITVGAEGTNAVFLAGTNMCVTGKKQTLCVTRPGGMVTVKATPASAKVGAAAPSGGTTSGSETDTGGTETATTGGETSEPVYVGLAAPEQIGLIFESTNTGGDGGTTQLIEPQVVESTATTSGLVTVGASSEGATSQPPVTTTGQETTQDQTATAPEPTATVQSDPQTSTSALPPEVVIDMQASGIKTDISALGTSGEARFDGLATATIFLTGGGASSSSFAGGRYLMTYDFGTRSGAATITGLVDTTLVTSVSEAAATGADHYGGAIRDASNFAVVGTLGGAFFTTGGDPAASTAGTFDINRALGGGVTQSGSGTFEAPKVLP